ncbi:MAG: xanthine dehydrogenase family protein subunit M [Caldilineae bacterium]|nr:MAG: xanthine dehydrogenase family protein subunit M [Caldilineae bacterium]
MKPAPFKYHAPTTVDEVVGLLAEHGYDAKILAGGQSLIPTMNFRLAQPAVLIDINAVSELAYIKSNGDGGLRVGALARHAEAEHSRLVAEVAPLVHATMPLIAHPQIRNRGTLCGSLAHADPASELPAVLVALQGRVRASRQGGSRWIAAEEFFQGIFTTALEPDELLAEAAFPPLPSRSGWAIQEVARRHGDFALAGAVAVVQVDEGGTCTAARLVFFGVGEGPVLARQAGAALVGAEPTEQRIADAAALAANNDVPTPHEDIHASSAYRRHLVEVLGRRALSQAFARATAEER